MTEADLGILWAKMAAKEGHRKGVPPRFKAPDDHPKKQEIKRLQDEGHTRAQIAAMLGMSKSRISQIAPLT